MSKRVDDDEVDDRDDQVYAAFLYGFATAYTESELADVRDFDLRRMTAVMLGTIEGRMATDNLLPSSKSWLLKELKSFLDETRDKDDEPKRTFKVIPMPPKEPA